MPLLIVAFTLFLVVSGLWSIRVGYRTAKYLDDESTLKRYRPYDPARTHALRLAHSRGMYVFGALLLLVAFAAAALNPSLRVVMGLAAAALAMHQLWELALRRRYTVRRAQ
jgi:MFS family permease